MAELRWHPMLEEWVAMASHRQVRPIALGGKADTTPSCPFCPGGAEGLNMPYEFVTFENKFPSFGGKGAPGPTLDPLHRTSKSTGTCEVVLYSDNHNATLAGMSQEQIFRLVDVWSDRYRVLAARKDVKYVYIFENKGAVIGVTLTHPHGQIYAFPFIPPRVKVELAAERKYRAHHRRCMLCDLVKGEKKAKSRIVAANGSFVAYIPYFARYPYEVHVVPNRHHEDMTTFSTSERWDFSGLLRSVIRGYDRLFGFSMPYIMLMHQSPTDGKKHPYHHFHVEFYPPHRSADKIKYLAGCESGAGTFINDTVPEEKAAELRRAIGRG